MTHAARVVFVVSPALETRKFLKTFDVSFLQIDVASSIKKLWTRRTWRQLLCVCVYDIVSSLKSISSRIPFIALLRVFSRLTSLICVLCSIISKWTEHFLFKSLLSLLLSLLNGGEFLSLHILSFHIRHNTPCHAMYENYETIVLSPASSEEGNSLGGRGKIFFLFETVFCRRCSLSFSNENKFN